MEGLRQFRIETKLPRELASYLGPCAFRLERSSLPKRRRPAPLKRFTLALKSPASLDSLQTSVQPQPIRVPLIIFSSLFIPSSKNFSILDKILLAVLGSPCLVGDSVSKDPSEIRHRVLFATFFILGRDYNSLQDESPPWRVVWILHIPNPGADDPLL